MLWVDVPTLVRILGDQAKSTHSPRCNRIFSLPPNFYVLVLYNEWPNWIVPFCDLNNLCSFLGILISECLFISWASFSKRRCIDFMSFLMTVHFQSFRRCIVSIGVLFLHLIGYLICFLWSRICIALFAFIDIFVYTKSPIVFCVKKIFKSLSLILSCSGQIQMTMEPMDMQ